MNNDANEQAETTEATTDAAYEEVTEGDAAAEALGGTGIDLVVNPSTALTAVA
jgi:hypothetical protein